MGWSREGEAETAGRRLAWVEAGPPEAASPLILVHGAGGGREHWLLLLRDLTRRGLRARAVELPGHGGSPGPPCRSVEEAARLVEAFPRAAGLETPVLAGHSMGGAVALSCALAAPDAFRGLILIGTGARLRVRPDILEALRGDFSAAVSAVVESAYAPGAPPALLQEGRRRLMRCPPEVLHADFAACDRFDATERVGSLRLPALVICGREDRLTPPRYAEFLAAEIAGARLRLVEGAGHMVMLERTGAVGEAIAGFCRGL